MNFSSFVLLSYVFFVLYFCRPTAADTIFCAGSLPPPRALPPDFLPPINPLAHDLREFCAIVEEHPRNLGCFCYLETQLLCGWSRRLLVRPLINYCLNHCSCGPGTKVLWNEFSAKIIDPPSKTFTDPVVQEKAPDPQALRSFYNPTTSTYCSGACTSASHGCASHSARECKCFAPPVGLLFWHQGACGTRLPFKIKRDLAQQRRSYYLNATAQFAFSNKATAPNLAAQLASGMLPSPCNTSYVSFACNDSPDGIVHELPENWLGALLPEGAKKSPPVQERFLRIHGKEEKSPQQVAKMNMD
ncbi:hypothetical protein MMC22_010443 [Lobaria immixta]|nr:hypothetical protein [Lobaria immixta]